MGPPDEVDVGSLLGGDVRRARSGAGSVEITVGSSRKGAFFATEANFDENSPYVRCSDFFSIRPSAAASQKAVVPPPLDRTTS